MHDFVPNEGRSEREERSVAQVDLTVRLLVASGDVHTVQLLDLSFNGCGVGGIRTPLNRDTPIGIELPGLTEFTIGRVAWCKDGEMGIQFETPLFEPVYRYLHDKLFGLHDAA